MGQHDSKAQFRGFIDLMQVKVGSGQRDVGSFSIFFHRVSPPSSRLSSPPRRRRRRRRRPASPAQHGRARLQRPTAALAQRQRRVLRVEEVGHGGLTPALGVHRAAGAQVLAHRARPRGGY